MRMSLEEIQQAVATLKSSDRYNLWRWLDEDFGDHENDASVEAPWDAEIASRLKNIQTGKVQLITGEQFDRRTTELFQELGIHHRSKLTNLRSEIAVGLNEADAGDFVSFTSEEIIREGRTRRSQPPLDNPSEVR